MKYQKPAILMLSVTLLLLLFQNCSVYESDGRKVLQQVITENSKSSCLPYIDNNRAVDILEAYSKGVVAQFSGSPPAGSLAECRISSASNSTRAIDNVVCGLSNNYSDTAGLQLNGFLTKPQSEQIQLLNQDVDNFIEVVSDPSTPLSGGSFGYSYKVGSAVVFRFLGANSTSSVGVACYFVFSSLTEYQDMDAGKVKALKRLSDITHEIVDHL